IGDPKVITSLAHDLSANAAPRCYCWEFKMRLPWPDSSTRRASSAAMAYPGSIAGAPSAQDVRCLEPLRHKAGLRTGSKAQVIAYWYDQHVGIFEKHLFLEWAVVSHTPLWGCSQQDG